MNANRPDLPDELRAMAEQSTEERGRAERAAAIIEQASHLTSTQVEDLAAAWRAAQDSAQVAALVAARDTAHDASQGAAQDAARHAALDAARHTARHADRGTAHTAWNAAWDVVLGLLAKDSIPVEDFRALTGPWESVMGRSWEVTA